MYRAVKYKELFTQPPLTISQLREGIPEKLISNRDGDGLSTDWSKYARPEDTQVRNGTSDEYGVVQFNVGDVRKEEFQLERLKRQFHHLDAVHDPTEQNYSHSLITGIPSKKDPDFKDRRQVLQQIRLYLHGISEWVILDKNDLNAQLQKLKSASKKEQSRLGGWREKLG